MRSRIKVKVMGECHKVKVKVVGEDLDVRFGETTPFKIFLPLWGHWPQTEVMGAPEPVLCFFLMGVYKNPLLFMLANNFPSRNQLKLNLRWHKMTKATLCRYLGPSQWKVAFQVLYMFQVLVLHVFLLAQTFALLILAWLGARLCRVQQRATRSHYQSKIFVCASTNCADAVDQLFSKIGCLRLFVFCFDFLSPSLGIKTKLALTPEYLALRQVYTLFL